jgi:hypothetical protein
MPKDLQAASIATRLIDVANAYHQTGNHEAFHQATCALWDEAASLGIGGMVSDRLRRLDTTNQTTKTPRAGE